MTTLEKAEYIVKNHKCDGFRCNCDGTACPALNESCGGSDTLPQHVIKAAQAYIDVHKPKENKLKTTKEFYQHMATEYERGQHLCDTGSIPYEFKTCARCPVTHLCGNDSRARYEFCKAQLAKETAFEYGQIVYDQHGTLHTFIHKDTAGTMLVALGTVFLPITTTMGCKCVLILGTFYAEDPTKKAKTMTITDIEKALGYKIKVVGEK